LTNTRGLAALILTFIFSTSLAAEYLYKDEVVLDGNFTADIEKIGAEVREKTGVGMYVAVIKELDDNQTEVDYANGILDQVQEPALVLVLSEYDKLLNIIARPASLYKDFEKDQVLSPFPNTGTILPFIAMKAKEATMSQKIAAGLTNGYIDIADQIATSNNVVLETAEVGSNKMIINLLRLVFYGMIAYGLYLYIKRKYLTKKRGNE
jgi:hypothetical protein